MQQYFLGPKMLNIFQQCYVGAPGFWMIFSMLLTIQKSNIKWCQGKKFLFCWCYKKYHFYSKNMMEKATISLIVSEYFSKKKTLFTFLILAAKQMMIFICTKKSAMAMAQSHYCKITKKCFKIISTTGGDIKSHHKYLIDFLIDPVLII